MDNDNVLLEILSELRKINDRMDDLEEELSKLKESITKIDTFEDSLSEAVETIMTEVKRQY